jgi:polysaccharide deacetylase 2 family uncharacterized protein YibQ
MARSKRSFKFQNPFKKLNRKGWLAIFLLCVAFSIWWFFPRDFSKETMRLDALVNEKLISHLTQYTVTNKSTQWHREGRRKWKQITLELRFQTPTAFYEFRQLVPAILSYRYQLKSENFYDNPARQRREFEIAWRKAVLYRIIAEWKKPETESVAEYETAPSVPLPPVITAPMAQSPFQLPWIKKKKGKIVFVIDDVGWSRKYNDILFSIKSPITIAILPHLKYSTYFAQTAPQNGIETILHCPMEAKAGNEDLGPGAIFSKMNEQQILQTLDSNLATVPNVIGINNHMGSLVSENERVLSVVLAELKRRHLFFLDSMTSDHSVGHRLAKQIGLPELKRNVFLDNKNEVESVRERVNETMRVADSQGLAIAIGHYRPITIQVLSEMIPELEKKGYQIIHLKDLT